MKTIVIDTNIYAKIWSERQTGEESENDILARLLGCEIEKSLDNDRNTYGLRDPASGLTFREGFEISKAYDGMVHIARIEGGAWVLQATGRRYPSLGRLTAAVSKSPVNAWQFWSYRDASGGPKKLAALRPPHKVRRRKNNPQ